MSMVLFSCTSIPYSKRSSSVSFPLGSARIFAYSETCCNGICISFDIFFMKESRPFEASSASWRSLSCFAVSALMFFVILEPERTQTHMKIAANANTTVRMVISTKPNVTCSFSSSAAFTSFSIFLWDISTFCCLSFALSRRMVYILALCLWRSSFDSFSARSDSRSIWFCRSIRRLISAFAIAIS